MNEIITEIGRIADTTKFNELYVLRGNPKATIQIEKGNILEGYVYQDYEATIPGWLSVSDKLTSSNSANVTVDSVDTTSNVVLQTSPGKYTYYGISFTGSEQGLEISDGGTIFDKVRDTLKLQTQGECGNGIYNYNYTQKIC